MLLTGLLSEEVLPSFVFPVAFTISLLLCKILVRFPPAFSDLVSPDLEVYSLVKLTLLQPFFHVFCTLLSSGDTKVSSWKYKVLGV